MKRTLQRLTGFHKIHHITFAYGYKIPFSNYGLFHKALHVDSIKEANDYFTQTFEQKGGVKHCHICGGENEHTEDCTSYVYGITNNRNMI